MALKKRLDVDARDKGITTGGYIYVDPYYEALGYQDVFTDLDRTIEHSEPQSSEKPMKRIIR